MANSNPGLARLPAVAGEDRLALVMDRDLAAALETPGFERVVVDRSARRIVAERILAAYTPWRARAVERVLEGVRADAVLFPQQSIFPKRARVRAVLTVHDLQYFLFFHELTDITHARTQIFFLFIIIELIIALNFRSLRYSIFKAPPHKWLVLAIVWEIVLIAGLIHIPSVRKSFGILKPSGSDIGIIVGFGVVVFASMEAIKAILRRKPSTGG